MKLNILHTLIILIGVLITCIISIINKYAVEDTLILILLVFFIFYFVGLIVRLLLNKIMQQTKDSTGMDIEREEDLAKEQVENGEEEETVNQ